MWSNRFRGKKTQRFIIFIMISLATILMAGSLEIFVALNQPYKDFIKDTNAPSVRAFMYDDQIGFEQSTLQRFKALSTVNNVISLKRHNVEGKVLYEEGKLSCELNDAVAIVEYNEQVYKKVRMIEGNGGKPEEGECLIPYSLANSHSMKLGGAFTFTKNDKQYSYKISGFYTAPYSCNILYESEVLVTKLPQGIPSQNVYVLYGSKGATGQQIVDEYVMANEGIMDGRFDTIENIVSSLTISDKILGGILLGLSLVVFLVCIIMTRFLIKNAMFTDRKSIAVYLTIGYTKRDIICMYTKFYVLLALSGSVVGALLSPLLAKSFTKQAFQNIGIEDATICWWPRFVVIGGILIVISLTSIHCVKKWGKMKPVMVLTDRDLGLGKKKQRYVASKKSDHHFSPFHMAIRGICRDKRGTIPVILTCFLTIYMVNFAIVSLSNVDSITKSNYYWLGFDPCDLSFVSKDMDEFDEICVETQNLEEVDNVIKNNIGLRASFKWVKGVSDPNVACMVYETYENLDIPCLEGRNPKMAGEVAIGNLLAKQLHKKVGDYLELYFGAEKKINYLIVGTTQNYMNMGRGIRILGDSLTEAGVKFNYTDASVYLKDTISRDSFIDKYKDYYKDKVKILHREDKYMEMLGQIADPQRMALKPFVIVVLLIGCINIISIIYIKNLENRKKYAIYQSIGYTRRHLLFMNLYYVGIIATISMLVAIPIFLVAFPLTLKFSMSIFGFAKYPVFFEPAKMILGNALLVVLFLASVSLTAGSLKKTQIKELTIE